jgi:hypothetical protein
LLPPLPVTLVKGLLPRVRSGQGVVCFRHRLRSNPPPATERVVQVPALHPVSKTPPLLLTEEQRGRQDEGLRQQVTQGTCPSKPTPALDLQFLNKPIRGQGGFADDEAEEDILFAEILRISSLPEDRNEVEGTQPVLDGEPSRPLVEDVAEPRARRADLFGGQQ